MLRNSREIPVVTRVAVVAPNTFTTTITKSRAT
jgi:hypothetical protein